MLFARLVAAAWCLLLHIQWPPEGQPWWYWVQWTWTLWLTMQWLKKWWSDTMWLCFFCLNSHIVGITDSATCKCFDTSTHMPKSKSQETCRVRFSSTDTFYPPAAYSPPNRNTFSNRFKALLFNTLQLKIFSNCAFVSMACKFDSNTNRFLTNYSSFTSINTKSIKRHWWLRLFIGCIGAKCRRGYLCGYCYRGYQHDRCKSIALPMIIAHDYRQIVLSPTNPLDRKSVV